MKKTGNVWTVIAIGAWTVVAGFFVKQHVQFPACKKAKKGRKKKKLFKR